MWKLLISRLFLYPHRVSFPIILDYLTLSPSPTIERVSMAGASGDFSQAGLKSTFKIKVSFTMPATGISTVLKALSFASPSGLGLPATSIGCTLTYIDNAAAEQTISPSPSCSGAFDHKISATNLNFQEITAGASTVQYHLYLL